MKLTTVFIFLAILFVISYDPKSGTLEKFIEPGKGCCDDPAYRAKNMTQCESKYYQGVQFGEPILGCPEQVPKVRDGAIFGR